MHRLIRKIFKTIYLLQNIQKNILLIMNPFYFTSRVLRNVLNFYRNQDS